MCCSCSRCDCDPAGSLNTTCNPNTGQCECKDFVEGTKCNMCVDGTSGLVASNPFGCSKGGCLEALTLSVCCHVCAEVKAENEISNGVYETLDILSGSRPSCERLASAPSQQPPPDYEVLGPTSLRIFWAAPDFPNGVITNYTLYRDGVPLRTLDPSSEYR